MNIMSENRICQNCKKDFVIEPEDFNFYEKIRVPPPTFCPECRLVRRMSWRNVRNLYKTPCGAPSHGENMISTYSQDKPFLVYDQKYWWSDEWDPLDFGMEYDFSVPFFTQFRNLLEKVPLPNLSNLNPVNTDYTNVTINSKNCYLTFSAADNENCYYSEGIRKCKHCSDLLASHDCEYVYSCVECRNCFNVAFGAKSADCIDSIFLYDCRNCSNCVGCSNLRNKRYHIFNKSYSESEYHKVVLSLGLDSRAGLAKARGAFDKLLEKTVHKYAGIIGSENSTGENIEFSHNCHQAFDVIGAENSKYVLRLLEKGGSDNYDVTIATKPELNYESVGTGSSYCAKFGVGSGEAVNSYYTYICLTNCSNLFACIGLRNKQYCILNKQYTKEEYENLVPKIIEHMNTMPYIDQKGRIYKYGEFFPSELSPFAYNETIAEEYFPLTKEEALNQGYKWKEKEERNYQIDIYSKDIPDNIKDVNESIINKVIECEHEAKNEHPSNCGASCTEAFKIIPDELSFYKRMNLPLPHLCPNCRHYNRLKQRNPLKLWHRKCMKPNCPNEFETSYSPERPEIVYCERCYQQEVY